MGRGTEREREMEKVTVLFSMMPACCKLTLCATFMILVHVFVQLSKIGKKSVKGTAGLYTASGMAASLKLFGEGKRRKCKQNDWLLFKACVASRSRQT